MTGSVAAMKAGRTATTGRRVLLVVAIATVAIGGVIVATVPRGEQERAVTAEKTGDAVVQVVVVVEEIDAKRGAMKVRVAAAATGNVPVPPEGISVLADVQGLEPLRVQEDSLTVGEGEGEVRFSRGSVSAYPFDRYEGDFGLLAVRGSPNTLTDVIDSEAVPMSLTVIESSSGFDLDASVGDLGEEVLALVEVSFTATRTPPVLVWVSIMMAIYWLLTAAVVAVVLVTVLGFREWETRHLAWLAAMIFAFTSFRAAAPDSPPIGVYFDFASFFWAELIVAVCLAVMVIKYLVGHGISGTDDADVNTTTADVTTDATDLVDGVEVGADGGHRA